ncbi:hypothetical protein [Halomonas sp. DP3Y7-2]|uniref:hypothetical protein n=1 Tax=Halomonas sp. DP3Y7-2 TaxID=2859083 RepID=UPI001C97BDFF|nr:hypothetical protein [Halomonas sp. DP3Y7-2]MBY6209190.1 hypothetical protein [Halomonas sp. DP3Y7-2]
MSTRQERYRRGWCGVNRDTLRWQPVATMTGLPKRDKIRHNGALASTLIRPQADVEDATAMVGKQ